jgi:hypothetical protein
VQGLRNFEYVRDDYVYRFASAEHLNMFKTDPVRYAPQFENFYAMALAKGQVVVADPENWLINDGKLYVFGSPAPAGPEPFQEDLAGNIKKANETRSILPKLLSSRISHVSECWPASPTAIRYSRNFPGTLPGLRRP